MSRHMVIICTRKMVKNMVIICTRKTANKKRILHGRLGMQILSSRAESEQSELCYFCETSFGAYSH